MRYIGPFLRINTLNQNIIKKQLFHFSKESLKHIVLYSNCGIPINIKELKLKNIPNIDINIFREISPLQCVYKKANPKMENEKNRRYWEESSFKKETNPSSNSFMTLSILELVNYYRKFENIDKGLYALSYIYLSLAKHQLDFYSSFMRNEEGVFVDKLDVSDSISGDITFQSKNKKFKFSDQALMMAAFYNYYTLSRNKDKEAYKVFSLDILNMFLTYKEELYDTSLEENIKLCLALNLFYKYSALEEGKLLLIDMMDYMIDRCSSIEGEVKIDYLSLVLLNISLFNNNTNLHLFEDSALKINETLLNMYNSDHGIFQKALDKKETEYSSSEIFFYLLSLLSFNHFEDHEDKLCDIYKRQLVNSGIVSSWPDAPDLNNPERYKNFSLKSEDLIEEIEFKLPSVPSPESSGLAPIIFKSIKYSLKKHSFEASKKNFYSIKNMNILFLMLHCLNHDI